jgi:hypothetical protein
MKSLTYYQTKNNYLIVYCETKKLQDFFNNISSSIEKDFFVIPKEKEKELIKILNYLNFVEKDGNPRFMNYIMNDDEENDEENDEDNDEVESSYTSSEKEYEGSGGDDDSSSYENESCSSYKKEDYEDDVDNKDINKFFKSFAHSDFIEKNKNEMKQKMILQKSKEKSKDKDKDKLIMNSDERKTTKCQEDEYSSSSYNSSSSDNFPSPKTPKRRNNFSNEQLYSMIEKLEKKINLIQRVLEKKIL